MAAATVVDLTPATGTGAGTGQIDIIYSSTPTNGGGGSVLWSAKNTKAPLSGETVNLAATTEKAIAVPLQATGFGVFQQPTGTVDVQVRKTTGDATPDWSITKGCLVVFPTTMPTTLYLYAASAVAAIDIAFYV